MILKTKRHLAKLRTWFLQYSLVIILVIIFGLSNKALADANLLTNPGAETNDLSGWSVLNNGGDGWATSGWDTPHSGNNAFVSSYDLDSLSQTVDLYSDGYTQNELDNNQPTISFSIWVANRCDSASQYYLTFELLGSDDSTVISSSGNTFGNSNSLISLPNCTNWTQETYTFSNYGPGVQYAYFEFGGLSTNWWAGNYGTAFDDALLSVNTVPNTPTLLGPSDLISDSSTSSTQPSFSADLADSGYGSQVQYEIQISQKSDYSNPLVDYTSALGSPGNVSFSIGQVPGNGIYSYGDSNQVLANGSYYWRIRSIADDGLSSSWSLANSGNVAFIVGQPASPPDPPDTGFSYNSSSYLADNSLVGVSLLASLLVVYICIRKLSDL